MYLSKYVEVILLIPFLLIGFTPYFLAVDKIGPQFLFLSSYNTILFLFFFLEKKRFKEHNNILKSPLFIALILFLIWCSLSFIYAINKIEVLIELSRLFIYVFSLHNLILLIKKIKEKELINLVFYIISFVLAIEIISVLYLFFERAQLNEINRDSSLRAFTGNINITAFVILFKIPILFWVINIRNFKYLTNILILCISFFTILLLGSRGANISLFFLVIFSTGYFLFNSHFKLAISIIISLISSIFINLFTFETSNLNVIQRTSNLNTNSTNQRLEFWSNTIESIKENPIFGIGLGNWKIKSIYYYKDKLIEYTVPYHAHNDFLQISAEVGIIGFILFYLFNGCLLVYKIRKGEVVKQKNLLFLLTLSIGIFLLDSNLNFPLARPIIIINLLIIISTTFDWTKDYKKPIKINKLIISIIILILGISSIFISYKVYNSLFEQNILLQAARGTIKDYSNEFVTNSESKIPNISATTVPLETMKANLLFLNGVKSDTVFKMIDIGDKNNPYLHLGDAVKAIFYVEKYKSENKNFYLDSAYNNIKKAYYNIPNNSTHLEVFYDLIEYKKDTLELDKAYSILKHPTVEQNKKYLSVLNSLKSELTSSQKYLVDRLEKQFPSDNYFRVFKKTFKVGKQNVEKGVQLALEARNLFENKLFEKAALKFEEAYKYNDLEIAYYENAANSYMQFGENKMGIKILEEMIERLDPDTGKAEYLLGIMYVDEKNYKKGCENFEKSIKKGFAISKETIEYFCNSEKITADNKK